MGLVLSGGGAKGLTHIGIIRALEENGIPIDYIAGTSMGAIVGSLYAMGYSPDEMEALLNPMTSNAGIQVMWKRNTSIISRKSSNTRIYQHPYLPERLAEECQTSVFAYQHCRSHSDEYCISAIIRSGNSCKQGQF